MGQAVRIGEHGDRAAPDGVSRVAPAVRRRARQRGEQVPRLGVLAAQGDAGDDGFAAFAAGVNDRAYLVGQWPERLAGGMRGTQLHGLDTVPAARQAAPRGQVACSVSGGPGSGDSGMFSRCSSQLAMLWNSGAIVVPGWPSAVRCGLSAMMPIT